MGLSQQIKVTSQGGSQKNEDAFHDTFPHFVWLLRDALTELPSDCRDIKDYFLKRVSRLMLSLSFVIETQATQRREINAQIEQENNVNDGIYNVFFVLV